MDADALIDCQAVEREVCRLPDVTAARLVLDSIGRPAEVHVLALASKGAKQIVRDVQSVAMAVFGLELDRRIISVVQFEVPPPDVEDTVDELPLEAVLDAPPPVARAAEQRLGNGAAERAERETIRVRVPSVDLTDQPDWDMPEGASPRPRTSRRIIVDSVTAVQNGAHYSAQVGLRRGDDQAVGIADGLMVSGSEHRLIAVATINALRQFEPAAARAEVEMATLMRLGERDVAVASVIFIVPPYEEIVAGSAVVRSAGEHDAMVRAVLNATNRRLVRLRRD
jgi:hypothetical protein